MNDKYKTLRAALKAEPTPGPWQQRTYRIGLLQSHIGISSPSHHLFAQVVNSIDYGDHEEPDQANADYITACDPDTIGALLQERDGLLDQHGRDSEELRRVCQQRDDARKQEERWKKKHLAGCDLISELTTALQEATNALAGGLWDYGPGQDEHDKCNEVIKRCQSAVLNGLIHE